MGEVFLAEDTKLERKVALKFLPAQYSAGEEFGEARIGDLAVANHGTAAAELIETILKSVNAHAGNRPQMDDMTLVVIQRETRPQKESEEI